MSDFDRAIPRPTVGSGDMAVDAGLRSFMLGVYNKLGLGLILSAGLAFLTSGPLSFLMFRISDGRVGLTPLGMGMAFGPLLVLVFSAFAMRNTSPRASGIVYWSVVSMIGASMGILLLAYTGASVVSTFLITATAFGALSLFGYVTKKDLSGFGTFLIMGVIGLVIASVVNIFIQSSMMQFIVSVAGVLIFSGLTAYDTQRLKLTYYHLGGDQAALGVATNQGALSLYLDFINLFQFLLSLFGGRR
ncbi:Bax inhibitor-1/YccA family protein [soil metagenome]